MMHGRFGTAFEEFYYSRKASAFMPLSRRSPTIPHAQLSRFLRRAASIQCRFGAGKISLCSAPFTFPRVLSNYRWALTTHCDSELAVTASGFPNTCHRFPKKFELKDAGLGVCLDSHPPGSRVSAAPRRDALSLSSLAVVTAEAISI